MSFPIKFPSVLHSYSWERVAFDNDLQHTQVLSWLIWISSISSISDKQIETACLNFELLCVDSHRTYFLHNFQIFLNQFVLSRNLFWNLGPLWPHLFIHGDQEKSLLCGPSVDSITRLLNFDVIDESIPALLAKTCPSRVSLINSFCNLSPAILIFVLQNKWRQ